MTTQEYLNTLQDCATALHTCWQAISRINGRGGNPIEDETDEELQYINIARHSIHLAATDLRDAQARLVKAAEYAELDLEAAEAERDMVPF